MTTNIFSSSLFDFDFSAENAAYHIDSVCAEADRHTARLRATASDSRELPDGSPEELTDRLNKLRELANRAIDRDRMKEYFRILDEVELYEAALACEPMPYGIPTVKLTYARDSKSATPVRVRSSADSAKIIRESYEEGEIEMQEYFKVLYLDRQNKVLGIHTASIGTMSACVVDPKIIFTGALLAHASSIIVCHNHPSGNLMPSPQDDNITRKLRDGGKALDIPVLDHIILTSEGYFSYADEGKI